MYKKNMKLGNKILILSIKFFFLITYNLYGNEEISTSQLINIEKIKPSFEEVEEKNESSLQNQKDKDIKQKRKTIKKLNSSHAILVGLDKITAKSSEILVNLNENLRDKKILNIIFISTCATFAVGGFLL